MRIATHSAPTWTKRPAKKPRPFITTSRSSNHPLDHDRRPPAYCLNSPPYPFRFPPRFALGVFNAINFTTTRNRYFRVCGCVLSRCLMNRASLPLALASFRCMNGSFSE